MIMCERCFEEYEKGEIYPSKYFNKILCTPCERKYEMDLEIFRISFINNQPERLSPEDKFDYSKTPAYKQQEKVMNEFVCDSLNSDNK